MKRSLCFRLVSFLPYSLMLLLCLGCSDEDRHGQVDQIPIVEVFYDLNLQLVQNQSLHQYGYLIVPEEKAGYRGLVIYKESPTSYRAFDRACPFHALEEEAVVNVNSSGFFMEDTSCGSHYDFWGNPTSGPARIPLRQYSAYVDGQRLIISNRDGF